MPLDEYEFSFQMPLPDSYERLKATPVLMRKFLRFLSVLLAHKLNVHMAALTRSELTEYPIYVCGYRCTSLPGDFNEDSADALYKADAFHTSRSTFDLTAVRLYATSNELSKIAGGGGAEASTDNDALHKATYRQDTQIDPVMIGEGEGKAVHWAVHKLLLERQGDMQTVCVHANDSDAAAALLYATPLLVTAEAGQRVILHLNQSYKLVRTPARSLAEAEAALKKAEYAWAIERLTAEIKALKKDPFCKHKTVDIVALWANIMRANLAPENSDTRCAHPVETALVVLTMGGNDYVDNLPWLGVATLWKFFQTSRAASMLSSALTLVQVDDGRHHLRFDEQAWLEFVYAAATVGSPQLAASIQRKYDETLGSLGIALDELSLEARLALANETVVDAHRAANGKRVQLPNLLKLQGMRAWLRRVMWSVDYFGNISVAPCAYTSPFVTVDGISLYGYERDPTDGFARPATCVLPLIGHYAQPFDGRGRLLENAQSARPIVRPEERSVEQIRGSISARMHRKRAETRERRVYQPPVPAPRRRETPPPKRASPMNGFVSNGHDLKRARFQQPPPRRAEPANENGWIRKRNARGPVKPWENRR